MNRKEFTWLALIALAGGIGFRLGKNEQPEPIKLKPTIVFTHFFNKTKLYRAVFTNDDVLVVNSGTNLNEFKIDFVYGNHNIKDEFDGNKR